MIIGIPKELNKNETRSAVTPGAVKSYIKFGFKVIVESEAALSSLISDVELKEAGAEIALTSKEIYEKADILLKVNCPSNDEINLMKESSLLVSFIQTTKEIESVKKLQSKKINAISMHLIPRTTLAQKMDALSSQSNIAGYKAVLMGACHIGKYMPLLMTAAGTIPPSKVVVIGAGVAGLQAIATAKRLGAQVEASDVRPEVKEQVESLGAKYIEVKTEESDGVGEGGYAKETSDDYKKKQQELLAQHISKSDMVITTALIPGRPAPILIPESMVKGMKPGSVIMDLASENGGNCELTEPGQVVTKNGVIIDGTTNIPGTMPVHATELYAKNINALITHIFNKEDLSLNMEDEVTQGSLYLFNGEIVDDRTKEALK
ncbi:Re/Si-specific NAD(P)(+) transhydrogenase subunit alpha [Candidatus Marinimicrobia bacterium]|nr:Re/Si-specific NAD(P)(+) transhydrogenase subunit alpha [Candidatus Neomarinimicrobiota bacterium]